MNSLVCSCHLIVKINELCAARMKRRHIAGGRRKCVWRADIFLFQNVIAIPLKFRISIKVAKGDSSIYRRWESNLFLEFFIWYSCWLCSKIVENKQPGWKKKVVGYANQSEYTVIREGSNCMSKHNEYLACVSNFLRIHMTDMLVPFFQLSKVRFEKKIFVGYFCSQLHSVNLIMRRFIF